MRHLLDLSFEEIEAELASWDEPRYRAKQIMEWVFRHGATDFEVMTNLPPALRARLAEAFSIAAPAVLAERHADDGATTKALLDLGPNLNGTRDAVETVRMDYDPDEDGAPDRVTVCISTQVGCAMACRFCATGLQGFTRNLSASEIVTQVLHFSRPSLGEREDTSHAQPDLRASRGRITNIVFMGMGEPLANYNGTIAAIRWLTRLEGLGLRQRGITVSTVGLVRGIDRLSQEGLQIGLTISLHAPDDTLRRDLIPTAGGTTIEQLVNAARLYIERCGRRVTFAYALLDHVNDEPEQARALARRIRGIQAHVNLIPYNPTAGPDLRRPSLARVRAFQRELQAAGVNATVRIERGVEIAAACGQLRTDVQRERVAEAIPLTLQP